MDPMQAAQMSGGQMMPEEEGGLLGDIMPEEPAENDPGYISARDWVADRLFGSGKADQKIADAVRNASSEAEIMSSIARIAYTAIDNADAQAQPPMKEENIVPLAAFVLEQMWEVATAAMGKQGEADPAMVAGSFKEVLLRFLQETGADTTELQRAMDQVTPDQIRGLMDEVGDAPADQPPTNAQQPQQQGAMPPGGAMQ